MSEFKFEKVDVKGPAQFGDNNRMDVRYGEFPPNAIKHPEAEQIASALNRTKELAQGEKSLPSESTQGILATLKSIFEHLRQDFSKQSAEFLSGCIKKLAALVVSAPALVGVVESLKGLLGL